MIPELASSPNSDILDRSCVSQLCKGWPVYRVASEWNHYRNLFVTDGTFIFTNRGTVVDLNPTTARAVGKMKTTITQRFNRDGIEFGIVYYMVFYEKDCVVPIDGHTVPTFNKQELDNDVPTKNNDGLYKMYQAMDALLNGQPVADLLWIPKEASPRY
ncbi:hypothetical protein BDV29DRAFT_194992 [Aspergillus leporis]|uniref:SnoaL-like domain-containing protein n=1 Tax=Aspergillus leporis TaxID=41062 RepID=A0A5N5WM10_9EURO|nr:hypothetical protein BDV29DRAFT_194992 [Aspergillus leporis]